MRPVIYSLFASGLFGAALWLARRLLFPVWSEAAARYAAFQRHLAQGRTDQAYVAYGALRELAQRTPEASSARVWQLGSIRQIIFHWLQRFHHSSHSAAGLLNDRELEQLEQLWADIQQSASDPHPPKAVAHMLVRTLTLSLSLYLRIDNRPRALEAFRLEQWFGGHCHACTATVQSDYRLYGHKLGLY